jgi:DNA-binding LytR/AlgR family response regulator
MKITEKSDQMDEVNDIVKNFIKQYGVTGLKQALENYTQKNHSYIICTKESVTQIRIDEIYYLEIEGHHIHVHTEKEKYRKYGTLNKELETLSGFCFMKCHQSYVVSLNKIKSISNNGITLINGEWIPMSRKYTSQILLAFHNHCL